MINITKHVYYVYYLIDPRDKSIFYVGKGTGNRISQHVEDAKKGISGPKCDVIRDILDDGLKVKEKIIKKFKSEDLAYEYEKDQIEKIGLENLTNIAPGGRKITSEIYYQRKEARQTIKALGKIYRKLVKYDEFTFTWCGIVKDLEKEWVKRIFSNGLRQVIEILGISSTKKEFSKYNIIIENRE